MNSFLVSGLLLATVIAVGLSELCTPDQWEGSDGSVGGYVHHRRPGMIFEKNYLAYDAKNGRKAAFITYVNNDKMSKFQIVLRHDNDEGKIYVLRLSDDKCWIKKMKKPFRKACIPDDAKKTNDYYMGLKGAGGLLVSGYEVKVKDMTVFLSVYKLADKIIPVGETIFGKFMDTAFVHTIGYMDITAGIKNETVFDVPKQCDEHNPEMEEILNEYLLHKTSIMGF